MKELGSRERGRRAAENSVCGSANNWVNTFVTQVNDTDFGHMMYNASLPWEELIHPWVTVARVSVTRQMPDDVMQITRYLSSVFLLDQGPFCGATITCTPFGRLFP